MKTIITSPGNVSVYLFEDTDEVTLTPTETITPEFKIADLNSTNAVLVENVTPPADWHGWWYTYSNGVWEYTPQSIPESVTALQGMRAINSAGLATAFLAWKAALDPVIDFETLAFLDKATEWRYDNEIIDAALAVVAPGADKATLFRLAATL